MPVNLELKIKLKDPDRVIEKLKSIRADYKGELNQTDIYYRINNYRLKLRLENGTQTLIKYLRNEGTGKRWSEFQLLSLGNNEARSYLKDILDEEVVVEKVRCLYVFDNTRIHIDNVKELGTFLELETGVISNKQDAAKKFDEIKNLLSLDDTTEIRKSYGDLLMEKKGK